MEPSCQPWVGFGISEPHLPPPSSACARQIRAREGTLHPPTHSKVLLLPWLRNQFSSLCRENGEFWGLLIKEFIGNREEAAALWFVQP